LLKVKKKKKNQNPLYTMAGRPPIGGGLSATYGAGGVAPPPKHLVVDSQCVLGGSATTFGAFVPTPSVVGEYCQRTSWVA
jgi:hypothetical protein